MVSKRLQCRQCGSEFPLENLYKCSLCGGILEVVYEYDKLPEGYFVNGSERGRSGIWKYKELLPVNDDASIVTLGEGGTPLVKGGNLSRELGIRNDLYLKLESMNPSGSFKDRPTSVAISKAKELNSDAVIVASSGNAAAATATYAARAGLSCVVCVPKSTDPGKVRQAIAHGAQVVYVEGSFSNSYKMAIEASMYYGWPNITSTFINPYTVEGDKTVSYELWEQMGKAAPDNIIIPIGAGPLLVGIYKGYIELKKLNLIDKLPRMIGVQATECSPITEAYFNRSYKVNGWVNHISTMATGIADPLLGYEEDGDLTLKTVLESGGCMISLNEGEISKATSMLSKKEGVYAEPTSAVSVGAIEKLVSQGIIHEDESIVCLITGHGLKYISSHSYIPPTITELEELKKIVKNKN